MVDVEVNIHKRGPFSRLVTHVHYWNVHYWNQEADGFAENLEGAKLGLASVSADAKAHLTLLRAAMALR